MGSWRSVNKITADIPGTSKLPLFIGHVAPADALFIGHVVPAYDFRRASCHVALAVQTLIFRLCRGSGTCQIVYRHINEIFVYIGWLVPPLERLERRDVAERQGGEFVEVDDCKRRRKKPTENSKAKGLYKDVACDIRL